MVALMHKNLLTKKFFDDNPIKELTVQRFVYTQIDIPIIPEIVSEYVRKNYNIGQEERKRLLNENCPDVLIKMLKEKSQINNYDILYKKILENEDVIIPMILEIFKRSLNSLFIENTVKIIAKTKKNYAKDLLKILDEIRLPYAISLACITLGFIADEEAIPVLMEKFEYFKKFYMEENYEQGPLFGLIKLHERFY